MLQKILEKDATLSHYGIKGQEWGKRRFQNEDGTLTPEGRKRYGLKTEYSEMSDQELRDAINKKRTQNQYVDLRTEGVRKKRAEREGLIRAIASTGNTAVQLGTTGSDLRSKKVINENKRTLDDSSTPSEQKQLLREYNAELGKSLAINKDIRDVTKKISDATSSQAEKISKVSTKGELSKAIKDAREAVTELDEKELRKTVDRMLLEKQYDELINPPKPSKTARGREVIQSIGALMSLALTGVLIAEGAKKLAKHSDEDSDYLAHYGVKGMKKGVRRWTNEDGTLTPEGYRHYGIDPNSRQTINQNADVMRQIKFQRRVEAGGAKYARRQAVLDAKNDARIDSIRNRQHTRRQAILDAKNDARIDAVRNRQALKTEEEVRRQAIMDAKNDARIDSIRNRQALRTEEEINKAERERQESANRDRRKRNKKIAKTIAIGSIAAIAAFAVAGRRLLRNKSFKKSTVSGAAKMASAGRELFPLIIGPR